MTDKAEALLFSSDCLRMPSDPESADPYYVLLFWDRRYDGERHYHEQWAELVRGASDVLEVIELAKGRAEEEDGEITFAVYVIAPDECGECKRIDLIRVFGKEPKGPVEVMGTFGWTMYMDVDDPAIAELGLPLPSDPREARVLRAQSGLES